MPTTSPTAAPSPAWLLTSTARSTFEELALLFAEPLGEAPDGDPLGNAFGDGAVGARVPFAGVAHGEAVEGWLAVRVSADVAAALAENMLGAAADPAAWGDAVGELANVVCGHVVSEAAGPAAVFTLSAPERVAGDAEPAAATGAEVWHAWLEVEGGRARVTLAASAGLFAA